ncbi:MAG: LysR family transcriptional regulator [Desulfovibrio sp.]|jgi:DNA-binding transcriptional LysR family regulator|nr:LysR family transcriptional regulator [Desulfovibrio sp.]
MNYSSLNTFLAVASSGSFTAAALELFITQPAVSQHIQYLETELGVRLFIRRSRGAVLTEEGKVLKAKVEELMRLLEDIRTHIQDSNELRRGKISIAVTEPAGYLLPKVLLDFKKRYPGVEIALTTTRTANVARLVADGEVEYGLAPKTTVYSLRVKSKLVHSEQLIFVSPPWHPLVEKAHVRPVDLKGETLALREKGAYTRERCMAWFGRHQPQSTIELTNMTAIRELAIHGCITFLPQSVVAQEIKVGRLATLNIHDAQQSIEYYSYYRGGEVPSKALTAFLRLLSTDGQLTFPENLGWG